jgi:hypothetical protein
MGYYPNNRLKDELSFLEDRLVVVGDAVECTNAMEAGFTGFRAGYFA